MKLALEPRPLFHRYQTNRQLLSNQPTTAFYLMKLANMKFSSLAANKLRSIESISYSFQHYALRRPVFLLSTSSDHMQPSSANYCLSMRGRRGPAAAAASARRNKKITEETFLALQLSWFGTQVGKLKLGTRRGDSCLWCSINWSTVSYTTVHIM